MRPSRTDAQLRSSFNFNLYAIKLAAACRLYGVVIPTEHGGTVRMRHSLMRSRQGGSTLPCVASLMPRLRRDRHCSCAVGEGECLSELLLG